MFYIFSSNQYFLIFFNPFFDFNLRSTKQSTINSQVHIFVDHNRIIEYFWGLNIVINICEAIYMHLFFGSW